MESRATPKDKALAGTIGAFLAFGMWGLFPLFWKQLTSVESMQILAHRIFWAGIFCLVLIIATGRFGEIARLLKDRKKFLVIAGATVIVTFNWGIYIWAVNIGRVTETALGYYINPLFSVLLGAVFFKEKTDGWTRAAVFIAAASIIGAAIAYGSVPWVSLLLAVTFSLYGAIKKTLALDPLLGLTVETLMAAPFALIFMILRQFAGHGAFINDGPGISILLVIAGILTAIPLIFFALAANSISLQKMGFIQYVSPTGQLFIGVVIYKEKPSQALIVAFVGVIAAVLIYVYAKLRKIR